MVVHEGSTDVAAAAVQKGDQGTSLEIWSTQQFQPFTQHCITQLWPSVSDYEMQINT